MAENLEKEVKQETHEKEYEFGYTVKIAKDGSVDVVGLEIEGKETISSAAIYDHIEELAELVKENKMAALIARQVQENTYYAVRRALADISEAAAKQAEGQEPQVEA